MTHQAHIRGKRYVRLTFTPHESKRRTVWAIELSAGVYVVVSRSGERHRSMGKQNGVTVEREEIILAAPEECRIEPAGMSLIYCRMELLPACNLNLPADIS